MNPFTNTRFLCSCSLPIGTCSDLDHPLKMEALVGPFVEGWALGKYSGKLVDKSTKTHTEYGYLRYGQLVHDFKYASFKLNQSEGEIWRRSIIDQLKISVDYFLEGYFPKSIRPFDTVVPVPSSSDSSETIQNKIAIHLREKGLNEARGTVKVNVRGHISTKNIPGLQGRMKSVGARYGLGTFNELRSARGLLLIDDVYETGATLRTTVSLLNQVVPEIPKFFLTIAYIS